MYGARRVRGKKETRGRDTKTTWKKRGEQKKYKIGSHTQTQTIVRRVKLGVEPAVDIFSSRRTNAIQQQQYRHEEAGWKPCSCSSAHIVTPSRPLRPKRVCASVACVCVAHLFTSSQIFAFRVRARRGTKPTNEEELNQKLGKIPALLRPHVARLPAGHARGYHQPQGSPPHLLACGLGGACEGALAFQVAQVFNILSCRSGRQEQQRARRL